MTGGGWDAPVQGTKRWRPMKKKKTPAAETTRCLIKKRKRTREERGNIQPPLFNQLLRMEYNRSTHNQNQTKEN